MRLARIFTAFRVATAFMLFGIGAVALAIALFPLSRAAALAGAEPDLFAQRAIARAFGFFVWIGRGLGLWTVEVEGVERLAAPGQLIVANHPTLMDVVFLLAYVPQSDCVVKEAAFRNPALAGIVRAANYIRNDGGAEAVSACVRRLEAGRTLLLFPEGSRSPATGLRAFKRGAAHVALRSGRPLVPVFVGCEPPALKKGMPFWVYPDEGIRLSIRVGEPIEAREDRAADETTPLAARHLTSALRQRFEKELGLTAR